MNNLENKIVLLTGATGGIGKAIAKAIIESKAKLVMVDVNEEALINLQKELGENSFIVSADLTKEEDYDKIAKYCEENFGKIDILINSVGMASRKPLLEVGKAELMRHFELNVYPSLKLVQSTINLLEKSNEADIISIVSSAGLNPYEGQGAYCASKYAQRAINEVLTMELFDKGIRLHNLFPSGVDTEMIRVTRPDISGDVYCKSEEIAKIILFILENRNNSVIDSLFIRRHAKKPYTT